MYFVKPNKTGSGNWIWCLFHAPRSYSLTWWSFEYLSSIWKIFQNVVYKLFGELNNTKCQITPGWMTRNIHYLYWETVLIQNKNLCQWMHLNYKKKSIWQNYELTLPIRGKWITLKTSWFLAIHITRIYRWS